LNGDVTAGMAFSPCAADEFSGASAADSLSHHRDGWVGGIDHSAFTVIRNRILPIYVYDGVPAWTAPRSPASLRQSPTARN